MSSTSRRGMVISPLWLQGVVLTFVVGFAILGYLALRVYEDHAPVPARVLSETGEEVFTGADVLQGQEAFLTYGLMEYGSVYGHGAYLGPDFTADYLHRQAQEMQQLYGGGAGAQERVQRELQTLVAHNPKEGNIFYPAINRLSSPEERAAAFQKMDELSEEAYRTCCGEKHGVVQHGG